MSPTCRSLVAFPALVLVLMASPADALGQGASEPGQDEWWKELPGPAQPEPAAPREEPGGFPAPLEATPPPPPEQLGPARRPGPPTPGPAQGTPPPTAPPPETPETWDYWAQQPEEPPLAARRADGSHPPPVVFCDLGLVVGRLGGPMGDGYRFDGAGLRIEGGWRFHDHLAADFLWSRPSLEVADDYAKPLTQETTMLAYGLGLRAYLAAGRRVDPYLRIGFTRFDIETSTEYQSDLFTTTGLPDLTHSGRGLELGLGLDVVLARLPGIGGRDLVITASGSVHYLMAHWTEIYCAETELFTAPDGSPSKCLYPNDDGTMGDSDIVWATVGAAVMH